MRKIDQETFFFGQIPLREMRNQVVADLVFSRLTRNHQDTLAGTLGIQILYQRPLQRSLLRRFLKASGVSGIYAEFPSKKRGDNENLTMKIKVLDPHKVRTWPFRINPESI